MDIVYSRTPQGQLLYDLGFTKLSPKWLARKHKLPIDEIRKLRVLVKNALRVDRKRKRTAS